MPPSLQDEYIQQLKDLSEQQRLEYITQDLRQSITSIGSLTTLLDIQMQDASQTQDRLRETIALIQIAVQSNKTILDAVKRYLRQVQDEQKRTDYSR